MSLSEHKDPAIIKNEIIMQKLVYKGSFLLVEGPDDSKFWNLHVVRDQCEIVICGGKQNLIGAIERLDGKKFSGILGQADDDFDSLEGKLIPSLNLVYTETHDLECLLFKSTAFNKILAEYGNRKKIADFENTHHKTVRDALLERGLIYGCLRWLAFRRWLVSGEKIEFNRFQPSNFTDEKTWSIKKDELYQAFIQQYANHLTLDDLRAEIAQLPHVDPWKICQGHDLIKILAIGLKQVLGPAGTKKGVGPDQIAPILRQGIECTEFCNTRLAKKIVDWEKINTPYRIFSGKLSN
ncbi:MAG: DUF4435 domain-containing protein [Thioploca sp.]|nr:DUF4435 domain-containing protein [Thioploca sp.]